jgi:hypothetical protein
MGVKSKHDWKCFLIFKLDQPFIRPGEKRLYPYFPLTDQLYKVSVKGLGKQGDIGMSLPGLSGVMLLLAFQARS